MADPGDGTSRRLAVLGSPIAHSLSPALHAAAYRQLGVGWDYGRLELRADQLEGFLQGLGPEWLGLSLTMPLKFEAARLVDECDHIADLTGAVNTIVISRDRHGSSHLRGFNTDVAGIVRSLAEHGISEAPDVLILGGGATAGSALAAAAQLGGTSVTIAVRTPAKAESLRAMATALGLRFRIVTLARAEHEAREAQLIISTLPGGAAADIDFTEETRRRVPLYDVAYAPWPSALAARWAAAGGAAYSGRGMLLQQALIQVRVFVSGDPAMPLPHEDEVLAAMRSAAGPRAPGSVEG